MRNSATQSGKELVKEIARLQTQLEDLAETVNARGGEVAEDTLRSARELIAKYGDTAKSMADDAINFKDKASAKLIEHTEARPLTTLAAIVGIGFLAGWLFRRH